MVSRSRKAALIVASIAALVIGLLAVWPGDPPTPPLLRGVTAAGGWLGGCPAESEWGANGPLALSPELNKRLADEFPAGQSEELLTQALMSQRFELQPDCVKDRSIRSAEFIQRSGSLFHWPVHAWVFWRIDEARKLVWTKGFVTFDAL